jgi:mediator of RNA polymerase II transcription subunit 12
VWETYLPVLQRLASRHPHPQITATLQDLDRRTKVLLQQSKNASSTQDPRRTVLSLLDAVDYAAGVNVDHLAFECMQVMPDARNLIFAVLDWASSFYRDGYHRVYLATRLLRRWSKSGLDIDDAILSYFHSIEPKKSTDPRNVFRIIAELVRSRTFSVGKYLQWLIATGSLNPRPNISSVGPRLSIRRPFLTYCTEFPVVSPPDH